MSVGVNSTLAPLETTTIHGIDAPATQKPLYGFAAVLTACVMSGFAGSFSSSVFNFVPNFVSGIYFEKILKGSKVSVWLRNVQLAVLAIPISMAVIAVRRLFDPNYSFLMFFLQINDRERVMNGGFMQGFDWIVWCVVLLQALGGLVVAVVVKYADNILKGACAYLRYSSIQIFFSAFATSIAIILAAVVSALVFGLIPQPLFIGGAVLVMIAVVLYSMPAQKKSDNI